VIHSINKGWDYFFTKIFKDFFFNLWW